MIIILSLKKKAMYKIHRDFEIKMDHLVKARKLDVVLVNRKKRIFQKTSQFEQIAEWYVNNGK